MEEIILESKSLCSSLRNRLFSHGLIRSIIDNRLRYLTGERAVISPPISAMLASCQMAENIGIFCLAMVPGVLPKLELVERETVVVIPDWLLRTWYANSENFVPSSLCA